MLNEVMSVRGLTRLFSLLILSVVTISAASADDGHAAIKSGAITFEPTDAINMEKEYLEISPSRIRVRFHFKNLRKTPYKSQIAFPLPPLTCGYWGENSTVSGFKVTVNGKSVETEIEQKAIENLGGGEKPVAFGTGKDISARVKKAGLPLDCSKVWSDKRLFKKAQKAGLAEDMHGTDPEEVLYQTETVHHWEQVFPADAVTVIEHEYVPKAGIGLGYCPYDEKRMSQKLTLRDGKGNCHLIDYVLSTAKTWKGPIGHFELSIPVDAYDFAVWSNLGPLKLDSDKKRAIFVKDSFVPEDDLVIGIWTSSSKF